MQYRPSTGTSVLHHNGILSRENTATYRTNPLLRVREDRILTEFQMLGYRIIHTDVCFVNIERVDTIYWAARQRKAVSSVG